MADVRNQVQQNLGESIVVEKPAARSHGFLGLLPGALAAALLIALAVEASNKLQDAAQLKRDQTPAIAVLPFQNLGKKDGQEFADGMTEEITNRLASLHSLRVIATQSAKSYTGSAKTPQEIATELNVKYVLTGTVRWDKTPDGKDLVRVSPALLRSNDANPMWTEAYQTALSGMFDVQSKVAAQVANTLNVTVLAPEKASLDARPTRSREAYSLYLRARQILDSSSRAEPIREAVTLLGKATNVDPDFVVAWAYLSIANTRLYWLGSDPAADRLARARRALSRGLGVNRDVPEIHLAHGVLLYQGELNYEDALKEFEAASALRPSDPNVPRYESAIQRRQGRGSEAVETLKRAVELDPRSSANMVDLANTYLFLKRYREADSAIDRSLALAPADPEGPRVRMLTAIHSRGNVPEAIEHMRNAVTTLQPRSSLTKLLLENPWPAVEDPSLRNIIVNAPYLPDLGRGFFYSSKASAMMYLGDLPRARIYADSATAAISNDMPNAPEKSGMHLDLAIANSILGNRRPAIDELARADEALPPYLDASRYADRENARIIILTNLGEYDAAITQMAKRIDPPGGVSRNYLRLNPLFAPMRANPRFQRLIQDR